MARLPLVEELIPAPDPVDLFRCFRQWPGCLFLDSALYHDQLGRYSFLAADPCQWISGERGGIESALAEWDRCRQWGSTETLPDLPPFQGGVAGLLAYELGSHIEPTAPRAMHDDLRAPDIALGVYDVVVSFDHQQQRAWILSHGYPETDRRLAEVRASRRLQAFRERMTVGARLLSPAWTHVEPPPLVAATIPVDGWPGVFSNFSRSEYLACVQRAIDYIHAGDVFQVNVSQRLGCASRCTLSDLYLRIRQLNPAPFSGYFDARSIQVASASPERFLKVAHHQVETRPIKGTRRRSRQQPVADLLSGAALRESEKDRAENIMIVDLLRNDLSRVCASDSIAVTQLCQLESYAFVQHLVSVVTGRMPSHVGMGDLWRATFPGGSITGAPKVRAMQIIAELEGVTRGPYCGCLGYAGWDGTCDWNILIRTVTASRGWWHFPVGGGIVADSVPLQEYAETWHKAEGILRAL